jgi:hypothetical protein
MIVKFVSINQVISKVVRDLGLTDQIPYQDFIEWIGEALQFIGGYEQYSVKCCEIEICDHTGNLPCDFYKPTYNQNNPAGGTCSGERIEYRIENGRIISNIRDGKLRLDYLAIPTDCDGYPVVPDDESYKTACFWYVAKMLALRGQLPGGLQLGTKQLSNFAYCHQRWDRYCGQARAQANMLGIDGMQRSANEQHKLIPDTDQYYKLFRDLGKAQILNRDTR